MKCTTHTFGADGRCSKCRKRRPGRPKNSQHRPTIPRGDTVTDSPAEPALPVVSQSEPADPSRVGNVAEDRAARLRSMFAPPPPPPPPPEPKPEPEAEPQPAPERTIGISGHDWQWVASTVTEGVDVVAGWGISRWSDLEPLEASESSRERFAKTLATFGKQRLGDLEVPTWIVLLICLVALIVSKIVGAPRKTEVLPKPTPRTTAAPAPPVPAQAAATEAQESASAAGNPVMPSPVTIAALVADGGSAEGAHNGF
jgi:hypothetical protein